MAPTRRGSGTGGATGGSNATVTTSASAVDGDLILIITDYNSGSGFTTPTCTGFTALASSPNTTYNRLSLLGRIASGDGSSYTVGTMPSGSDSTVAVLIYQDWIGGTLPTNIVTALDSSSTTTNDIPALTTAAADSVDLAIVGHGGNQDYGAPPSYSAWGSSLTEIVDAAQESGGTYYSGLGIASAVRASAALQAATTVTAAVADVSTSIRLEIKAAAGGAPTAASQVIPQRFPIGLLVR